MPPRILGQFDLVVQHDSRAPLTTRRCANHIGGSRGDGAIFRNLQVPMAKLRSTAIILEFLCHFAGISVP